LVYARKDARRDVSRKQFLVSGIYMTAWWQYFKNALTKDECEWLIQYAMSLPCGDGVVGHGGKAVKNEELRRSRVRWLRKSDPALSELFTRIADMGQRANSNAFGFAIDGFPHVQFTEYHADDEGTYGWHEDNSFINATPSDRKMSMVIQLSDPESYTGGKLLLKRDPLPDGTFCNQGDAIFFPSFNTHMVTPVKLGVRYSLVTWFVGPHFR
jgi:PKHD-type hydroxylase